MGSLSGLSGPANEARAVTPHNTNDLPDGCRALYVGGAGDISLITAFGDGTAVVFVGVPAGTILPVRCRRVRATGTTATNLVALF